MKDKVMIIIEILLILGALCIMGLFVNKLENKKNTKSERDEIYEEISKEEYNKGTLLSLRYTDEQSDIGNTNEIELEHKEDNYTLTTRYNTEIGEPIKVVEYKVDKKDFEKIESLIKKYNIPSYDKFKDPEEHMLDGGYPHLTMFFDETATGGTGYTAYSVDYEKEISTDGITRLREIYDKLSKLKQDNNIIKEYTE